VTAKSDQDLDPNQHWFRSLDLDQHLFSSLDLDPHRCKKLDSARIEINADPKHWNKLKKMQRCYLFVPGGNEEEL
jgi:hypothetical protein